MLVYRIWLLSGILLSCDRHQIYQWLSLPSPSRLTILNRLKHRHRKRKFRPYSIGLSVWDNHLSNQSYHEKQTYCIVVRTPSTLLQILHTTFHMPMHFNPLAYRKVCQILISISYVPFSYTSEQLSSLLLPIYAAIIFLIIFYTYFPFSYFSALMIIYSSIRPVPDLWKCRTRDAVWRWHIRPSRYLAISKQTEHVTEHFS